MEEEKNKFFDEEGICPIRDILCRLGDKWSMLVLVILHENGTLRFSELQRLIPDVSQRMLTVTLRALESDSLISRKVYAEVPPRVEYHLTSIGESFIPHLEQLVEWALQNRQQIVKGREKASDKK